MSKRVTEKDLERIVERINKITKSPLTSYTKVGEKYKPNGNNYHLDYAYGGVALYRMCNDGTSAVNDVLRVGHVSKRELQKLMFAYIAGLENENE